MITSLSTSSVPNTPTVPEFERLFCHVLEDVTTQSDDRRSKT